MVAIREQAVVSDARLDGLSVDAVSALSAQRKEPTWLRELRQQAWAAYERLPMPSPTSEGWRRTNIRDLRLDDVVTLPEPLAPAQAMSRLPAQVRNALRGERDGDGLLVSRDGSPAFRQLAQDLQRRGVILTSLEQAVRDHEDLVRPHLGQVVSTTEEKFAALHAAFWSGGVFLYVPRGVAVEVPLHALTFVGREYLGAFPHTLIVAEAGAELTLVDEYLSTGRQHQGLCSGAVEIVARADARVRYVQLQEWGPEQWTFSTMRALIERNASVNWLVVALGGRLTKSTLESRLVGDGGETEIRGLVFGDGRQHFDYYTLQSHLASDTRSDLSFKAVLQDRASSNYTGMVHIAHQARRCDANQESRNMLLSDGAKADADPRLEILNSDVIRATHGATVGPVDEETLFYVMSRGLSRRDAQQMLVHAFFDPILARVPLEPVRKKLWASIDRRLGAHA